MSDQDRLTPPERELEQTLRSLRPAAARFDLAAHAAATQALPVFQAVPCDDAVQLS